MFDTGRWESHIFYQNWSCRQIIWWRDCDKGIQNKHFCVNNGSSDWLFFQNLSIQWEMLLFRQIRSSPHAFPPITGSQLRYENSLLMTQEAVTPYKYLSLQNICHSWGPASTNYNSTDLSETLTSSPRWSSSSSSCSMLERPLLQKSIPRLHLGTTVAKGLRG